MEPLLAIFIREANRLLDAGKQRESIISLQNALATRDITPTRVIEITAIIHMLKQGVGK